MIYSCNILIIIIIIGSTALRGLWPPQENIASNLYPGHPPANFYNPVSLRLPLPRQSILIFSKSLVPHLVKKFPAFCGT
jgi:hypothetical protein